MERSKNERFGGKREEGEAERSFFERFGFNILEFILIMPIMGVRGGLIAGFFRRFMV